MKKEKVEATLTYQGKSVDMNDKKATENLVTDMVKDIKKEVKTVGVLTETRKLKKILANNDLLDVSRKMAEAERVATVKNGELEMEAEKFKGIKSGLNEQIGIQSKIIHDCAEQIRNGYAMVDVECIISYKEKDIIFTTPDGEVVEQRPMTESEQLKLSGKAVDAEDIIREDREKSVAEEAGEEE